MEIESNQIGVTYDCDVLVIGSGVSGYCAAIQAARCDCNTILLEKDEVLGGNSGPNLGVSITGAGRYNAFATETGIIQELQEDAAWTHAFTHVSAGTLSFNISRRYEAVVQEHLEKVRVFVLKRHYARLPIMNKNRIVGVIAEDLAAFSTVKITVRHVVIEASGDGHIAALAGADFDMGSEGKDEFGERSAPSERVRLVQGTSLVMIVHKTNHEVIFHPPANNFPFRPRIWQSSISSFFHHHQRWFSQTANIMFLYITETGGHMDTIKDDAEIYERLLKQLWAEWNHIKNGPHKEEAKYWDLLWVSPKAGKRESRRFLGDYLLTQTDVEEGRRFPDDIGYGGHDLDDHQPLRDGANIISHSVPPLYGIPYRCCYSRNIVNLLLAGRLISATHLAHSSTRVMRTGAAIGQAVGMAAGLCCYYNCTPRDIYDARIGELQEKLLRFDATILAKSLDPKCDLALSSTVGATSEIRFNDQTPDQFVPLITHAGNILWDWNPHPDYVELFLRNDSEIEQTISLSIYRTRRDPKWKNFDDFHTYGWDDLRDTMFKKITTVETIVPVCFEDWHRIEFSEPVYIGEKDPASDDDRLLIALEKNQNVSWATARRTCEVAEMVEHSPYTAQWRTLGVMGTMRISPVLPLGEAENLINGYHRRFSRGPTNMWISDPSQGFPQDIILSWSQPQKFNRVTLTFDNLPWHHHNNPWESGKKVLDILVKAYTLDIWKNKEWEVMAKETCNRHRFRTHTFEQVVTDRLRLRILSTHGEKQSARVYQVSVYNI